jgi:hypothetical protein
MAQQFFRKLYRRLKSEGTRYIGKVGLFAVAVTIVSYWISYQDRITTRQNSAWDSLRAAISWTEAEYDHYGNFGQIAAIQTLTHDCGRWWRNTFLEPAFELIFPDCVDLKSVVLSRMELGGLQAAGATFSYGNLSCTNLATANLRNAALISVDLHGAYMAGADLSGANLTGDNVDFRLTNLSWVGLNSSTQVNLTKLKCACINFDINPDGTKTPQVHDKTGASTDIIKGLRGLKECPTIQNTCDPKVMDNWTCAQ